MLTNSPIIQFPPKNFARICKSLLVSGLLDVETRKFDKYWLTLCTVQPTVQSIVHAQFMSLASSEFFRTCCIAKTWSLTNRVGRFFIEIQNVACDRYVKLQSIIFDYTAFLRFGGDLTVFRSVIYLRFLTNQLVNNNKNWIKFFEIFGNVIRIIKKVFKI